MQNFINLYAIIGKKILVCYYKNEDTLTAKTTRELEIPNGSLSCSLKYFSMDPENLTEAIF